MDLGGVDDDLKPVVKISFGDPTGDDDNSFSIACEGDGEIGHGGLTFINTDFTKSGHPLTGTSSFLSLLKAAHAYV